MVNFTAYIVFAIQIADQLTSYQRVSDCFYASTKSKVNMSFKVYPRKIDVYFLTSNNSPLAIKTNNSGLYWQYAHSTNAYNTCKAAVLGAKLENPLREYKANFSR